MARIFRFHATGLNRSCAANVDVAAAELIGGWLSESDSFGFAEYAEQLAFKGQFQELATQTGIPAPVVRGMMTDLAIIQVRGCKSDAMHKDAARIEKERNALLPVDLRLIGLHCPARRNHTFKFHLSGPLCSQLKLSPHRTSRCPI